MRQNKKTNPTKEKSINKRTSAKPKQADNDFGKLCQEFNIDEPPTFKEPKKNRSS